MGSDSAGNRKHFDSDLFNVLQVPGLPPLLNSRDYYRR